MMIRPPGRITRTNSLATSKGFGANIAPKMLTPRSKLSSSSSCRSDASPSWNLQLVRPRPCARAFPASTRLLAMSTPRTSAPSLASGTAVVPSPHPRSRTLSPLVMPNVLTSASPLSRMLSAMRVKSPFSQSALFGFIALLPFVVSWRSSSCAWCAAPTRRAPRTGYRDSPPSRWRTPRRADRRGAAQPWSRPQTTTLRRSPATRSPP